MIALFRKLVSKAAGFFDDLSFQYKLAFSYLLILLIPLTVAIFLVASGTQQASEQKAREAIAGELERSSAAVNATLDQVEDLAKWLADSTTL